MAVSLLAVRLSRRPPTPARPPGYPRATTFAALVNASWLVVLCLLVGAGAIDRLASGVHTVHGLPVLIASGAAAVAMVFGALVLRGGSGEVDDEGDALNMRAVLLDTATDAAAAAGVAITGAAILVTGGFYWLDPAVALVVCGLVAFHAVRLLRRVTSVLCSTVPARLVRAGGGATTPEPRVTAGTGGDVCH
jgi:cobalt-zinc-cadmium efflux system protein